MQIHHLPTELPAAAQGGAVAIGNFDGVHRGHARLIDRLVERAAEVGGASIVFTFDPHPARLLRPAESPAPLTWIERKAELLAQRGVEHVVAYPTDEALLRLSAREFFDLLLCDTLGAKALVEGPNFFFGHNREGDVRLLGQFAEAAGMTLDVVTPTEADGELISSSRIRRLIGEAGDLGQAAKLLTAPYRIRGIVTHGSGRGAKIGVPTANLEGIDTLLPAPGVYAAIGRLVGRDGPAGIWPAAVNVGANPTFGEHALKVETHLIGCEESIYGRPLEVDFLDRLRDVQTFESADRLVKQVNDDIESAKQIAGAYFDNL